MSNRTFKIVGRITDDTKYHRGKIGRQAKKRVYTSAEDYHRYGPELADRWAKWCGFDVEHYELIDGKWIMLDFPFAMPEGE